MSRIFDVVPFFNETEMLLMRMEILDKHVDFFVIGEATTTFSGKNKPLYFKENRHLFKKFEHKIIHSVFVENKLEWDHWDRDKIHKNAILKALQFCKDDDIIISSDCDEIPNLDKNPISSFYKDDNTIYHMMQNMYYYYINLLKETDWYGSKICSYKLYKERNFDGIRNSKGEGIKINNAGWHFTFLGGTDKIIQKIESWGHQEFNNDHIKSNVSNNLNNNRDIFYRPGSTFTKVPIDNSYPKYLLDNIDKYESWIKK